MSAVDRQWKVLPHGRLTEIEDGILTVVGELRMPLTVETIRGTEDREAALVVRTPKGVTLVLNDIVGNLRNAHGIGGLLLTVMGFAGAAPRIPRMARWMLVKDPKALQRQFLAWSDDPSLARLLVSHGEVVEGNARQTLRDLAASLGG